ncbi:AAA ATPase domain-containing protein [Hathewaya proteolytica DSM 3090]|uniref:AAA ATPase domain-containing protein n=1 Tax=Hathewaya proteolytica DSM 3090 TaxID=1121331 RepID=A0A1M6KF68_9CLOT|nr:ATP-binding protein [Hathewaya proteolytica]SHJ57559.1 AAA ATPase domain-containing protein [Hathewaya proteolytica DSM 3090]
MKIHSMKVKNFRGYSNEVEIFFNDLTVFVGKNDIGKSTILEALDIFFNDGKGVVKLEKSDVNIQEQRQVNQETIITICFKNLPERIIIDSTVETTLEKEYLLNEDGFLEVEKKYKNGGTPKVFIRARHPTNVKCTELLLKKNTELKKIVQTEGITCNNQTVNSLLRKAIWEHYSQELNLEEIEIDASKEDAKKIWDKLSTYLPIYSLFQSDRKNSDGDNEVQDPLKEAVKQILADEKLQNTLINIANEVQTKLQEVANRTLDKLRDMDSDIANSLNPVIPTAQSLKWQDVFKGVSISGDEDIPINKRGSGVKRLILLNFFRGEVERRFNEGDNTGVIYAIEEPETSQHTDNQRKLIDALKVLAKAANVQVILTTHSAFIVKQLDFANLRMIINNQGCKEIINVLPGQLQYPSLNEVNYVAFNEVTEEYHDELYSYIEFQGWKNNYITGKPTRLYHRQKSDGSINEEQKILTEYIRHQIHHPENHHNVRYTIEELKQSIDEMRDFVNNIATTQSISEP